MDFTGNKHNNTIHGTADQDRFDMSQGGNDTVFGEAGNDIFTFGGAFTAADHVYGGPGGDDLLTLDGDYSSGLIFGAKTMTGIETLELDGESDYVLTMNDGNVAAHRLLYIEAGGIVGNHLELNASAETNGNYYVVGTENADVVTTGAGDDRLYGGNLGDTLDPGTGHDKVYGGSGDDTIVFTGSGAFDAKDVVDGGADDNTIELNGSYADLVLHNSMMTNVLNMVLDSGHDYTLDFTKMNTATFIGANIYGGTLGAGDVLHITGKGLGGGFVHLDVIAGAGDDVLIGTDGYDDFTGGGGADLMNGGPGTDVFGYSAVSQSTSTHYDTVIGFNTQDDDIDVVFGDFHGTPDAYDGKLSHGTLSTASFNADLAAAIGKHQMKAGDAVMFHPSAGTLKGEWFVVVDGNGKAGYQAGHDLVVHLENPQHIGDFSLFNFGTAG